MHNLPDLKQLQTFLAVVNHRGFGSAARHLGVSQPSISQQMRRLEDKLQRRLFARDGGVAILTPDGEALLIFAKAMRSVLDELSAHFGSTSAKASLNIGVNPDIARDFLQRLLRGVQDTCQDCEPLIECSSDSRFLFTELDEGRLDLVIAKLPSTLARGKLLKRAPLEWIGSDGDIQILVGTVPLVLPSPPDVGRELVLQSLAEAGRTWRVRFQSPDREAIQAAVCAGIGVSAEVTGMTTGPLRALDHTCGLPTLPDVTICLDRRSDNKLANDVYATFLSRIASMHK